jgi:aminopeptidase N
MRLTAWLVLCLALIGAAVANASGGADRFFPGIGDLSYEVDHYDVELSYDPSSGVLDGTATIEATATQALSQFSLDLEGLRVTAVTVNGKQASFSRRKARRHIPPDEPAPKLRLEEGKLDVVTAEAMPTGAQFTVTVEYHGVPKEVINPSLLGEGWIRTDDGAVGVSTGAGTPTWMPCNNIPADKATYTIGVMVPKDLKAVSNGRLSSVIMHGAQKKFTWTESQPMSSYLAVLDIGRGRLVEHQIDGLPSWTFVDSRLVAATRRELSHVPEVIRFESKVFGPYPFDSAGSILDISSFGYAEETQTRPIYFANISSRGGAKHLRLLERLPLVHELAHQWFGDSVGLASWPEIWLNEGFATWAEWYFEETHGGEGAAAKFRQLLHTSKKSTFLPPPGNPGSQRLMYAPSVYERGAMALQALRMAVGTKTMLSILRRWTSEHRYGSADTQQFIALAGEVSGRDLRSLFRRFLFRPGKP